jgi:hypothetical protein
LEEERARTPQEWMALAAQRRKAHQRPQPSEEESERFWAEAQEMMAEVEAAGDDPDFVPTGVRPPSSLQESKRRYAALQRNRELLRAQTRAEEARGRKGA